MKSYSERLRVPSKYKGKLAPFYTRSYVSIRDVKTNTEILTVNRLSKNLYRVVIAQQEHRAFNGVELLSTQKIVWELAATVAFYIKTMSN